MRDLVVVSEYALVRNARDFPDAVSSLTEAYIPDGTFQALKQLATETADADAILTFSVQKGREVIRVKNYVGLVGLPNGTQVEILPKVTDQPAVARTALLNMLRHLRHSPFRTLATQTGATFLPLWDVFSNAFLDALSQLVSQGVQRTYVPVEGNERYWKGKFQVARHLRDNARHAERLAVSYEALTVDSAPNRVLKTTLFYLQRHALGLDSQRRKQQLLWALDDVPASESLADDLRQIRALITARGTSHRQFARYKPALQWADVLLQSQAFGLKTGRVDGFSLLFPMQRIFEDYVAHGLRHYYHPGQITVQESSAHLVDEHIGAPRFRLQPDVLIRQPGRTLVLDTKWKRIDGADRVGNYGIEQADLYQLYAYGKKYEADQLFLVYPANETFGRPLDVFGYDESTHLHVVPFDVTRPLHEEIERLTRFLS
ncbi:restriction endonuclease [Fibrisoma montanum]|uniref:Restriction endonuclease n=1 Tax=Fibrisoma montanum TaxID=2305895 RepID=A0A418MEV5_9BACT|nr:McrC family protein [Fibrisoma montanum]RIV25306.1 restriction endonuclease [Fibrisoma montanum]